jgi:hypothetical protein
MPTRRFPTTSRHRSARGAPPKDAQLNLTLKAIESERDNLSRAESLLRCLSIAMEHEGISHKGPYYPDVAEIAREMVRKSIGALDPINLPSPPRDKVREEFFASDGAARPGAMREVPLLPRQMFTHQRSYSLRIHRRNYLARVASSWDSASANMSGCESRVLGGALKIDIAKFGTGSQGSAHTEEIEPRSIGRPGGHSYERSRAFGEGLLQSNRDGRGGDRCEIGCDLGGAV